jgi:hypothetical protein
MPSKLNFGLGATQSQFPLPSHGKLPRGRGEITCARLRAEEEKEEENLSLLLVLPE